MKAFGINIPCKKKYFIGNYTDKESDNMPIQIAVDTFRYLVWQYKREKKLPNFSLIWENLQYLLEAIFKAAPKIKAMFSNCNAFQAENRRDGRP